jgi:hypothetical protein
MKNEEVRSIMNFFIFHSLFIILHYSPSTFHIMPANITTRVPATDIYCVSGTRCFQFFSKGYIS